MGGARSSSLHHPLRSPIRVRPLSKKKIDTLVSAVETWCDFQALTDLSQDRELLRAFRDGDPAALQRVYFDHARGLERRLRAGLVRGNVRMPALSDADVRDVLQEVFIRAFSAQSRRRYDGLRPFETWLRTIARNLLIDRARKKGLPRAEAEALDFVADEHANTEQNLLDAELRAATAKYVASLDPEQRRFVELRFEQERSQDDVARTMDLTRRRIRTLEKRVHAGLRAFLEERGLQPTLGAAKNTARESGKGASRA